VLIVSNLYPPHYLGGYELRCAEVAAGLRRRGHQVEVLTSSYGVATNRLQTGRTRRDLVDDVPVHRTLGQYAYGPQSIVPPWTLTQARRELRDARHFIRVMDELEPEVVCWWSMNGLSKIVLPIPASRGCASVHFLEDPWMIREYGPHGELASAFWTTLWGATWGPPPARPLLRRLLPRWRRRAQEKGLLHELPPAATMDACFVSRHIERLYRAAGFLFRSTEVILGGIPLQRFLAGGHRLGDDGRLRLLYASQLSHDRGLHTLIAAVARLDPHVRRGVTLSVVGGGDPAYRAAIERLVHETGLGDCVQLVGKVQHRAMPAIFQAHDVLVFPSMRDEGLPLTMVEALLSGCAVITTRSGGADEVATLADLPTFVAGDDADLATLLSALATDRERVRDIAVRGQAVARTEFDAERMIDRLEGALRRVSRSARERAPASGAGA
jgi:glycosyltransferase involved in cell wall biosynthesis